MQRIITSAFQEMPLYHRGLDRPSTCARFAGRLSRTVCEVAECNLLKKADREIGSVRRGKKVFSISGIKPQGLPCA